MLGGAIISWADISSGPWSQHEPLSELSQHSCQRDLPTCMPSNDKYPMFLFAPAIYLIRRYRRPIIILPCISRCRQMLHYESPEGSYEIRNTKVKLRTSKSKLPDREPFSFTTVTGQSDRPVYFLHFRDGKWRGGHAPIVLIIRPYQILNFHIWN